MKEVACYFKRRPGGHYYSLVEFRERVEKAQALEVTGISGDVKLLQKLEKGAARKRVEKSLEDAVAYPYSSAYPSATLGDLVKKAKMASKYKGVLHKLDKDYARAQVKQAFEFSLSTPGSMRYSLYELSKRLDNAKLLHVPGLRKCEEALPALTKQYALNRLRQALEAVMANSGRGSFSRDALKQALQEVEQSGANPTELIQELNKKRAVAEMEAEKEQRNNADKDC